MTGNLSLAWGKLLMRALASSGATDVVLSPGSRNTPLALAAAAEPELRLHRILDERVAGFYALGQARVTGRPSVLVCTSGTAAAHYLPAVLEADEANLPLIVLSADRPWELRHLGAAQTTDQTGLFGTHVRLFWDLGPPEGAEGALVGAMRAAAQASLSSRWPQPGPVHLNVQLRKPLEPTGDPTDAPWHDAFQRLMGSGGPKLWPPRAGLHPGALEAFTAACQTAQSGIIACGAAPAGVDPARATDAVRALAHATGFVVLAEATSQVRPETEEPRTTCARFDLFLEDAAFRAQYEPDLILEMWGGLSSTSYARFVADHPRARRIVIAPHAARDPYGRGADSMVADPVELAQHAVARLGAGASGPGRLKRAFLEAEDRVEQTVARGIADEPGSEAATAAAVVASLPEGALLWVGNSSPVRDIDAYGDWGDRRDVRVLHQRGVNGIDGMIAGAAGARSVSRVPVVALVGDATALHDAGGLAAVHADERAEPPPLAVVVVNNQGGRLFERLPIADARCPAADTVEELFVMPQRARLGTLAEVFGVPHAAADGASTLRSALTRALSGAGGTTLVESEVPPGAAATLRRRWVEAARAPAEWVAASDRPGRRESSTPLALLHGFLGDASMWQPVVQRTEAPAHLLRLPGHGRDAANEAQDPIAGAFERAAETLAERLPHEPSILVGYSMGARLAMLVAARHPRRLRGLVLLAGHPGLTSAEERDERRAWEEEQVRRLQSEGLVAFAEAWGRLPLFATQAALPSEVRARQRASRRRHTEAGIAWAIRALGLADMPNLREPLAATRLPTWIVVGEHDEKYRRLAASLAGTLHEAHLVVVPGAGHNVALEAPERLAARLDEITSQRPSPGAGAPRIQSHPGT